MKKIFFLFLCLLATANAFAVTPADPTNVRWYDCGDESGNSYLTFTLPTVDVDGNPLDVSMMGYRIYTDDDLIFTFEVPPYDDLGRAMTDIYSFLWDDGTKIQSNSVYFYRTNADGFERFFNERIGVQIFYLNPNFTIGATSNIVYTYLDSPVAELPIPANPKVNDWIDYEPITWPGGYYADCMLGYSLAKDSNGNLLAVDNSILEPENVSFSVYTDDDKIFTFTPEMFDQVDEPVTQFPYSSVTAYGYVGFSYIDFEGLTNHVDVLAEEGIEMDPFFNWRIGIQTQYTKDGQTTSSDIVYMEIYPQLQEAKEVTSTSFLADWSCNAENTYLINNFRGDGCGYFLHVIDKATQEEVLVQNVEPTNPITDENGHDLPFQLSGAYYTVEGLTPGNTYEFYVVVRQNAATGYASYQSVTREVTLLGGDHGYEPGDVNHDEAVSIADVTDLIDYLLGGTSVCLICADVNGDEAVSIADVTDLIDKLLSGGGN